MNIPPKVRKLTTLGNVEVWVCEAKNLMPCLGPLVLDKHGNRVGQLVCFEVEQPPGPYEGKRA